MPGRTLSTIVALLAVACALPLAGCGGSSSGAQGISRTVKLTANQETTANSSTAAGTATVTISPDNQRIVLVLQTSGLTGVTASHIHAGLTGTSGLMGETAPVVFTLYETSQGTFPSTLARTLTVANFTPQPAVGINTFADALAAIRQGRAYVNVHTTANPTGEIRGQILPNSFTAQLAGANERPTPTSSVGRGTVVVSIDPTNCTFTVNGSTSFLNNANVTAAHIHVGPTTDPGPVIFPLFASSAGPYTGIINKSLTQSDLVIQSGSGIDDCGDAINAVITGNAYVNLHTTDNPAGEIRGQLLPTSSQ